MNINDFVWVRLTPRGRDIDRAQHEKLRVFAPTVGPYVSCEKNGWSRFQLYRLMYHFGRDCYMGADLPFDTEISLVDPNAAAGAQRG
jgi:hypothetical protein